MPVWESDADSAVWFQRRYSSAVGTSEASGEHSVMWRYDKNCYAEWNFIEKRHEFLTKWWFLLQGEAWPQNAQVAITALGDMGGTSVEHPPWSPDLASCDFWAFLTLKWKLTMRAEIWLWQSGYASQHCDPMRDVWKWSRACVRTK